MAKRKQIKRNPKDMKLPLGIETEYYAYLLEYTKNLKTATDLYLFTVLKIILENSKNYIDYTDKINEALQKTQFAFSSYYTDAKLAADVSYFAKKTSDFQEDQLRKYIFEAVGVDIFLNQPYLQETLYAFVQNNVSLIKTIETRYFDSLRQKIFSGIQQGIYYTELKQNIIQTYNTSKWNAERIARDQITSLYAQLNQYRQEELGIDEYIWRGMMDNREREKHVLLEGQRRKWSSTDIKPGQEILCRCWAQPVLDNFFKKVKNM